MTAHAWSARIATGCAALSLAFAGLFPGNNSDTFGHLAQGRQIAELGAVPRLDSWSLLPESARGWHNYEWLSDLGTYLAYAHLGYGAITLFKCLLLVVTVLALGRVTELLAGTRALPFLALTIISAIPALRVRLTDRPHVFGICLAALYLWLLSELLASATDALLHRRRVAIVAAMGLLHVAWVNLHGSHLLGIFIVASFLLCSPRAARRPMALVLGLCLLGSCISPYGPAIALDAVEHVFDPRYRRLVSEWQPFQAGDPPWLQLGPALQGALLALVVVPVLRRSIQARALCMVAMVLGIACFRSIRFIAEFMLLSAPLCAAGLAHACERFSRPLLLAGFAMASVVLAMFVPLGCAALPPFMPLGLGVSYRDLPRASAELLASGGGKPRVLAAMEDAWFTMFVAPNARFVVDGRVPFYGAEHVTQASAALRSLPDFTHVVDRFRVNALILRYPKRVARTLLDFTAARGFSLVLIEDQHALFVRDDALGGALGARFTPLTAVRPSYALDWLFAADAATLRAIDTELARLAEIPGTSGFRAFVRGVLTLAPLRRAGPSDGFRWPKNEADWSLYRKARPLIAHAAQHAGPVPSLSALNAELASVFCDFTAAERALSDATHDGLSREPLLVMQELALRQGRAAEVRTTVAEAQKLPQGAHDPWLAELATGVDAPPACP